MNPTLLVLTNAADRTEQTERTAQHAAVLGAPLRAELVLVPLDTDRVLPEPARLASAAEPAASHEAATMRGLRALASRLPAPTSVLAASGSLVAAVATAGRKYHPLLLALGLRPERSLPDQVLSQVQPVLQAMHRPLLLVPTTGPAPGLPRRVLLAVDGEPFCLNAASRAVAPLLAAWPAAYTVAHILPGPGAAARSGHLVRAAVHASGLLPRTLLPLYQEIYASPVAGILRALADTRADLLVLIARPRSFLGQLFHRSVTATVLRHCPVPVLLLPAEAPPVPGWLPWMG